MGVNINPLPNFANKKVLPAAYDDSLSYYELNAKVLSKTNEVVGQVNANTVIVDAINSEWPGIKSDAQEATASANAAASSANSGASAANAAAANANQVADTYAGTLNELDARISNIIANGQQTEGNTELIDIRNAWDGRNYATAGDAVRGQAKDAATEIGYIQSSNARNAVNFLKLGEKKTGYFFDPDGDLIANVSYTCFLGIPAKAGDVFKFYPSARFVIEVASGMAHTEQTADVITEYTVSKDCLLGVTMGTYPVENNIAFMYRSGVKFSTVEQLAPGYRGWVLGNAVDFDPLNDNLVKNAYFTNGFVDQYGQEVLGSGNYKCCRLRLDSGVAYKIKGALRFAVVATDKQTAIGYSVITAKDNQAFTEYTPDRDCVLLLSVLNTPYIGDTSKDLVVCESSNESTAWPLDDVFEPVADATAQDYEARLYNGNLLSAMPVSDGYVKTPLDGSTSAGAHSYYLGKLKAGTYRVDGLYRFLVTLPIVGNTSCKTHDEDGLTEITLVSDSYIMYTVYNDKIGESFVASDATPSTDVIDPRLKILRGVAYEGYNVLFGKTWYACGDSFTDYTNESYEPADYPQMVEDVNLKNKTYPFWIGVRNNMKVHNLAISGQTLATPSDGTISNAFSNAGLATNYKYIPDDADYITIMLGINDSNHPDSIPVGTIDDATNATFYGAWNVVLPYLIEHHPFAHIGIIVTNGAGTEYVNATIECARKWGIAYLNLDGDYTVPLMQRTYTRTETSEQAKQYRLNQFSINVAGGDTHPNVGAHEYESTFIENWLRSL